jgi:hypothetical protein
MSNGTQERKSGFVAAGSIDDAGIPNPVHVAPSGEESNLGVVPPSVAVVADVQRLVKVANQVDDEPQGDAPFLDRSGRVPKDRPELLDLVHDASLPRVRSGESRVVSRLIEGNVHVVPGCRPLDVPLVLIGPSRGVRHRLAGFEQRLDGLSRLGVQVPLGNPGRKPMPEASPCPSGRGGLEGGQQGQGDDGP